MSGTFDSSSLEPLRAKLVGHPVFYSVTTLPRLRVFMEHHVYPVWDFMSLLKSLQQTFAPHGSPWLPDGDGDIRRFVNEIVTKEESDQALPGGLAKREVPEPARRFMQSTFDVIASGEPHRIAAAFALGREDIVPGMFKTLLAEMKITESDAPTFHYYLTRHTHLDEESHGPMALRMLSRLCGGDVHNEQETLDSARMVLQSRIDF